MTEKRRYGKRKTVCSFAMAVLLGFEGVAAAEGLSPEASSQIQAVITLSETDFAANTETIRLLLQQCLDGIDSTDPAAATLNSILLLLDTGTADAQSVTILLKTLIDTSGSESSEDSVDSEISGNSSSAEEESMTVPEEEAAEKEEEEEENAVSSMDASVSSTDESEVSEIFGDLLSLYQSDNGLPVYEESVFSATFVPDALLIDVPGNWGNNASGRSVTSYSPANGSGAIDPSVGTLMISYFPMEGADENESFDIYEKSLEDMSVTMYLSSEDVSTANLPSRKISFGMGIGANQFDCEVICFAYEGTVYAVELMQGRQSEMDYFPTYYQVVDSAQIGTENQIPETSSNETIPEETTAQTDVQETGAQSESTAETVPEEIGAQSESTVETMPEETGAQSESTAETVPEETGAQSESTPDTMPEETGAQSESTAETVPEETTTQTDVQETGTPSESPQTEYQPNVTGDIGTFHYSIGSNEYQFPTPVYEIAAEDLNLDRTLTLPYDYSSDADMNGGSWSELVNTQYYSFQNEMFKEMIGVTNLTGYPALMTDCVVTALIDTQGTEIGLTLPGNIRVGSTENEILNGFPEFAQTAMDGTAAFRGNELLYARNIRDDGTNGYAIMRNDYPYYSAVSIICDEGIIIEISFECVGSERAEGIFL